MYMLLPLHGEMKIVINCTRDAFL